MQAVRLCIVRSGAWEPSESVSGNKAVVRQWSRAHSGTTAATGREWSLVARLGAAGRLSGNVSEKLATVEQIAPSTVRWQGEEEEEEH